MRPDWRAKEWEKWGKTDPYFGVVAHPELRADRIDEATRDSFFRSGENEINETLTAMRAVAGEEYTPGRTLDFGCGVGRLTIPLARASREVIGVDVSPAMIAEARMNCARFGLTNVGFRLSTPRLEEVEGQFDFVHSSIVFQHIPPAIGYEILESILDRVAPTGSGMLHVTYGRRGPALGLLAHRARRSSKLVHRLMNVAQRRPLYAPLMAMYEYDLGRIVERLQSRGFVRIGGRLTDHGGCLGVMLAFTRTA